MKNNAKVLEILMIVEVLLIYSLYKIEIYFYSPLLEMLIINLLTGVMVSFIVAYISYNEDKENLMDYFFEKIYRYYFSLLEIEKYIKNSRKYSEKDVVEAIGNTMQVIIDGRSLQKSNLDFYFPFGMQKSKDKKQIFFELYEKSFGIEMYLIGFETKFKKKKELTKKGYIKLIQKYKEKVTKEIDLIEKGIFLLEKKYKINKDWVSMLAEIKKSDLFS